MRSFGWRAASMFAAVAVLGVAAPAQAAPAYPGAHGRCVDQADVLGATLCAKVTAVLMRDEAATSDEIAVAVVPTTGDTSIESWSTGLFNKWGVGKKDKNNGVLLVVAVDDHRARLETGRGLRDRLSDSDAKTIIDDVTAHFRNDEYALGILTGLDDVRRQLGHTIASGAKLTALAGQAPTPEVTTDSADDIGTATDSGSPDSGTNGFNPNAFGSSGDFPSQDGQPGSSMPLLFCGFVVVALILIGFGVSRRSRRPMAGNSSWSPPRGGTRRSMQSGFIAGSADSVSQSSSSSSFSDTSSSSSSSNSSFGGGSSDGGGSSGSW